MDIISNPWESEVGILLMCLLEKVSSDVCWPAATAANLVESGFGRKSVGMLGPQGMATQLQ